MALPGEHSARRGTWRWGGKGGQALRGPGARGAELCSHLAPWAPSQGSSALAHGSFCRSAGVNGRQRGRLLWQTLHSPCAATRLRHSQCAVTGRKGIGSHTPAEPPGHLLWQLRRAERKNVPFCGVLLVHVPI